MKEIIDKTDFIKIQIFCSVKGNVQEMRRGATDREKIFAKDTSDKEPLFKIQQELLKFNKKTNSPIKTQAKDLSKHLTKENVQMQIST